MKRIFIVAATAVIMASCGNAGTNSTPNATEQVATEETFYGDKITAEGAIPVADLNKVMGDQTEIKVKLEAPVDAVCQKKGCWMDLKTEAGEPIRVTFKDYAFFVPKDAAGKTAIVDGVAKIEETSVADLQEYAKDAGKTEAEIAAITTPKKELVFEASGVILK